MTNINNKSKLRFLIGDVRDYDRVDRAMNNIEQVEIKNIGLRAEERKFEELMTKEESEFAYDLGEKYAVLTSQNADYLKQFYEKYEKAVVGSYNSSDAEPITKERVRDLLEKEGLV